MLRQTVQRHGVSEPSEADLKRFFNSLQIPYMKPVLSPDACKIVSRGCPARCHIAQAAHLEMCGSAARLASSAPRNTASTPICMHARSDLLHLWLLG